MKPYDHTSFYDPYKKRTIDTFDREPEFILQFIRDRNNYLKKQLSWILGLDEYSYNWMY